MIKTIEYTFALLDICSLIVPMYQNDFDPTFFVIRNAYARIQW